MAKTKISEFSATPANNTDIDSIFIGEGMAPSNVNDAIRELMAQLKDWQSGTSNDPYVVGSSGSLTLNQGTANTVPYLNGSKVVTSGTALSFDGTNLGLGVTPSAWGSGSYKGFQVGGSLSFMGRSGGSDAYVMSNTYFDQTNYRYTASLAASRYTQSGGEHQWFNAPSGTAGNAITFTQAMTLDASGNLALGKTSTSYRLGMQVASSGTNVSALEITNATNASFEVFIKTDTTTVNAGGAGNLVFATGGSVTERARIDSSGNLLVGTTSVLINSSNRRGISVAAPSGAFVAAVFANAGGTAAQVVDVWNQATSGNNVFMAFGTEGTYTERGSISYSRGAGLTVYGTTSDYRAKDIIGPVTGSGALIDSTPVYMGKMKGATQERPMFIAHETPDYAHTGEKDAVDENGNPKYQQMDASSLVPILWAEVQSLRKRLADAGIA